MTIIGLVAGAVCTGVPDVPLTEGQLIIDVMEVTGHITSSYHLNTSLLASAEAQHRAVHQEDRQRAAA